MQDRWLNDYQAEVICMKARRAQYQSLQDQHFREHGRCDRDLAAPATSLRAWNMAVATG
jgi:hypothetical protein